MLLTPLSAESSASEPLEITATDSGSPSLSHTKSFTVTVNNVNDPPTTISLSGSSLKENISGATVGVLTVTDQDAGQTHTFTTADPRFEIEGATLKLKVDAFVVGATASVDVTATDSGTPPQTATPTVVINVTANPRAWQNVAKPLDTNGDGSIVPLDALRIINQLNDPTILAPNGRLPDARPATSTLPFYDVNEDGFCSTNDVIRIFNYLNSLLGEGEAASSAGSSGDSAPEEFVILQPQETTSVQRSESAKQERNTTKPGWLAVQITAVASRSDLPSQTAFTPERLTEDLESILDEIADEVLEGWLAGAEGALDVD